MARRSNSTTVPTPRNTHGDHVTKFPPFDKSFTDFLSGRENELLEVTRDFLHMHECWVAAGDDDRPHPDEEYWHVTDTMIETFDAGDVPLSLRPLFQAVEKFREQVNLFDQRMNVAALMPPRTFWIARDQIEESFFATIQAETEPVYPPLEPIKLLIDGDQYGNGKVNWQQVAKMYRWFDKDGNPDVGKVMKEYREPGSVITDDWVDPRIEEWRAERMKRKRQSGDGAALMVKMPKIGKRSAAASDEDSKPCKETPFELWKLPGMRVEQAAKMLKKPMDEVQSLFDEFQAQKDREEQQRLGISSTPSANPIPVAAKTPTPVPPVGRAVPKTLPMATDNVQ